MASDLWPWPRRSRPWPRTYGLGLGPMASKVQALASDLWPWPRTYGLGLEGPGLGLGLMALASDLWSWSRRSRPLIGLGPMALLQ